MPDFHRIGDFGRFFNRAAGNVEERGAAWIFFIPLAAAEIQPPLEYSNGLMYCWHWLHFALR